MSEASNCWPNESQAWLLKAALSKDVNQAKAYWSRFCHAVDIQTVDYCTTSLTPLVYKRFRNLSGPEIQVAKSVYRHTWSSNNLSLHTLRKVIDLFARHGIPVTLLKGAAMIANYYRDPGLRVVGDMDILVPHAQVETAMALLQNAGWRQLYEFDDRKFDVSHAHAYVNPEGVNMDLHWRILSGANFDPSFINFHPEQQLAHGLDAFVFCPEDQLVHILIHGHNYSPVPLIRWVPDASTVINQSPDFRWEYFFTTVNKLKISYVVAKALTYLHNEMFVTLRESILERVRNLAWTHSDKRYFDFIAQSPQSILWPYRYVWLLHTRINPDAGLLKLLATLPPYLKRSRSIDGYGKLFVYLLKHAMATTKRTCGLTG